MRRSARNIVSHPVVSEVKSAERIRNSHTPALKGDDLRLRQRHAEQVTLHRHVLKIGEYSLEFRKRFSRPQSVRPFALPTTASRLNGSCMRGLCLNVFSYFGPEVLAPARFYFRDEIFWNSAVRQNQLRAAVVCWF